VGVTEGSGCSDRAGRLFSAAAGRPHSDRRRNIAAPDHRFAATGSSFQNFSFKKKKTAAVRRAA
jgi:hypothetical protein